MMLIERRGSRQFADPPAAGLATGTFCDGEASGQSVCDSRGAQGRNRGECGSKSGRDSRGHSVPVGAKATVILGNSRDLEASASM